ncbi:MAG: ribonuclease HII [Candidatus Woesearchaeota archaeon]
MRIIGIDEAGRGPVIGPLVMAALLKSPNLPQGLQDSKQLNPKQRLSLYTQLCTHTYAVQIYDAQKINELMSAGINLNMIEVLMTVALIEKLRPQKVIMDCPSRNIPAFVEAIKQRLTFQVDIQAEYEADIHYPVVSGASIIAKVLRDQAIKDLEQQYGVSMGSGYPHDAKSIACLKTHGTLPVFRTHWQTYKKHRVQQQVLREKYEC